MTSERVARPLCTGSVCSHMGIVGITRGAPVTPLSGSEHTQLGQRRVTKAFPGFYFWCRRGEATCIFQFLFHFQVKKWSWGKDTRQAYVEVFIPGQPGYDCIRDRVSKEVVELKRGH